MVGTATPAITAYTGGAAADNETYIADPGWAGTACNGWVLSNTSVTPPTDSCVATYRAQLNSEPEALGIFQGQTPSQALNNRALTEYTGNDPGAGVLLQTSPNNIPAVTGHYYNIAADFAAVDYRGGGVGCDVNDPLLRFSLLDGATLHTLSSGLDPCTAVPASSDITVGSYNVRVAKLTSTAYRWTGGATMGLQLYNAQGTGQGNDVAFDSPQIVDVTP